jgi:hypothetical protein
MHDDRPTIDELVVGDEPSAWAGAGFSVDDDGTCRIGSVRVRLAGRADGPGVRSWSLRGIDPPPDGDIDGLATTSSGRPPAEPARHPNGVIGFDHVVVASSDGDRTAAAITSATGLDVRRIRETTSYGSPMRQWFFRLGEVVLEMVAPDDGDGRTPTSFFGLALNVQDISALPDLYGEHLSGPKDAVQPGRRIATLRHRPLDLSVPIAFMSPDPRRA